MKLNLGSGTSELDGFDNLDGKNGDSIYPLECKDDSCEVIRASHCLEHFSHLEVADVIRNWSSKLEPGGLLQIAVPDMEKIATQYLAGQDVNVQGFIFGGQKDGFDYHYCGFDREVLVELLLDAGLERIHVWQSEIDDCAAMEVSLNLAAYKPVGTELVCKDTVAVLSAPRFGPVAHFRCAFSAFARARVRYQIVQGAYWHQVICETIESQIVDPAVRYVITCDYDTVFRYEDVTDLYRLMERIPEADALFALQSKRDAEVPIFGLQDKAGKPKSSVALYHFNRNIMPVSHGHFGLTIFRADKLREFERPWMTFTPNEQGRWGEGKKDADVDFWHRWRAAGNTLFLAPRVVVGHLQEMITWPGKDLKPVYQSPSDYDKNGRKKS